MICFRGNGEDHRFKVSLLYSTLEYVWLPTSISFNPGDPHGRYNDRFSSLPHIVKGSQSLPNRPYSAVNKGEMGFLLRFVLVATRFKMLVSSF